MVQRIPILQSLNQHPGKPQKQPAWHLERIPSSVVVHKRVDSSDTRLLQQTTELKDNPLEHNLGFFDFGKYHKAADDANFAFEKVGDLLAYDIDSDEESDDGEPANSGNTDAGDIVHPQDVDADVDRSVATATIDTTVPATEYQLRRDLVKEVKKSKDKLFIIRRARPGYRLSGWYIVQVDDQETNWRQAKDEGIYHVRFFVRALADSRHLKVRNCKYWPELHEFKRDGVTMGPMIPTKPSKVDKLLLERPHKVMWYQDTINLFEHKIVGPFDFADSEQNVPQHVFDVLMDKAPDLKVYVGDVNRIVPLDKPDRNNTTDDGTFNNYLSYRWKIQTMNL